VDLGNSSNRDAAVKLPSSTTCAKISASPGSQLIVPLMQQLYPNVPSNQARGARLGYVRQEKLLTHQNTMKNLLSAGPRLLLGLIFTVFGLNGFLQFIPMPPPEGVAAEFLGGLAVSGYFFPMMALTQILVGVALLLDRFTGLALVILAPITINIVAFHSLAPDGMPLALLVVVLHLAVAWQQRSLYLPLLQSRLAA
jgi:putative oxidoreductase